MASVVLIPLEKLQGGGPLRIVVNQRAVHPQKASGGALLNRGALHREITTVRRCSGFTFPTRPSALAGSALVGHEPLQARVLGPFRPGLMLLEHLDDLLFGEPTLPHPTVSMPLLRLVGLSTIHGTYFRGIAMWGRARPTTSEVCCLISSMLRHPLIPVVGTFTPCAGRAVPVSLTPATLALIRVIDSAGGRVVRVTLVGLPGEAC
ncbi:hypothetical protein BH23GEM6_BH23GEM6_19880 [soil metagenome]